MHDQPLKVIHISTADNVGGSGKSAYKIHRGLQALGHDSKMLVSMRITDDPTVKYVAGSKILQRLDKWLGRAIDFTGLQNFGYFASLALPLRPSVRQAHLIQLYNLHHYYTNQFLPLLFGRKPLVWRLSDQWAFTGHCAYSYDCERWLTGCGSCPALEEYDPLTWDTSAFLWKVKRWAYSRLNLTVVAPSLWMKSLAEQSPILGKFAVHYIPNGVDPHVYRPAPKAPIRQGLGIPHDAVVLLFSAHGLASERKGGSHIKASLASLDPEVKNKCFLLLVGEGRAEDFADLGISCQVVKEFRDEKRLASFYQAADVGIFPSRAENLPNTVLEAMACGVPCVSFSVGGITDAILPGRTGLLAPPYDVAALASAIQSLVLDPALREKLGAAAAALVLEKFTLAKQAESFETLYRKIMEKETAKCAG